MTQSVRAAGPPGYGGESEGTVGEQNPPDDERGPETKSELGDPPSVLEKPIDEDRTVEPDVPSQIGVPADLTE